jgi:hypothetical protein
VAHQEEREDMRIISMHKVTPGMEAGEMPDQELIQGMGRLMGDVKKSGALIDGAGLLPSRTRVRLRFAGGERSLQKGPYGGENELISSIAMLKVGDMDEAIDWASRYGQAVGDADLELGPVTEAWDLGMMPKPEGAPLRCLLLHKGTADSEAGKPLAKAAATALSRVTEEMKKAGVLLLSERLQPSRHASRIKVAAKKPLILDGPFAESKELIAGYVVLELPSVAAAHPFCLRFAEVLGDVEMDVYPLV